MCAARAIFLASGASGYITGQCIAVDGGFLASVDLLKAFRMGTGRFPEALVSPPGLNMPILSRPAASPPGKRVSRIPGPRMFD